MVRYIGLDVLRGIAAFGIVGCHLCLSARTDGGNLVTALCVLMCVCVRAALAGGLKQLVRTAMWKLKLRM